MAATLEAGLWINDKGDKRGFEAAPCKITLLENPKKFKIVLTQGKNHQVRRMLSAVGGQVTRLKRIRIGSVFLGKIPAGDYLTLPNVARLNG